jgi:hypothetical protein
VIEVAQPDGNFITGGGYLKMSDSAGTYTGTAGSNMNFGFNVKYNSGSKPQPQGHLNIIFRSGGRTYQIKCNAINSLSLGYTPSSGTIPCTGPPSLTCFGVATFSSKANLTDVTVPNAPVSLGGSLDLVVSMTDKGEPGSSDSFSVQLKNGNTLLFSSSWTGTRTVEKLLVGGNLVVH